MYSLAVYERFVKAALEGKERKRVKLLESSEAKEDGEDGDEEDDEQQEFSPPCIRCLVDYISSRAYN